MTSDKERREIASGIRQFLSMPYDERPWEHDGLQTVGRLVGAYVGESILARLACLIDRPTCHVVRYLGVNSDGEREYEMACGSLFKRPVEEIMPYYCPWCGGQVVEKEEDDDER